jgi:hypothetical protein
MLRISKEINATAQDLEDQAFGVVKSHFRNVCKMLDEQFGDGTAEANLAQAAALTQSCVEEFQTGLYTQCAQELVLAINAMVETKNDYVDTLDLLQEINEKVSQ